MLDFPCGANAGDTYENWTWDGTKWVQSSALGGGGMKLLNTLVANNSATLDDTSSITSAYSRYRFVFLNVIPVTNAVQFWMRLYISGTLATSGYAGASWSNAGGAGAGGVSSVNWSFTNTNNTVGNMRPGITGEADLFGAGTDPQLRADIAFPQSASVTAMAKASGFLTAAGVVSGVQFLMGSGNIASGTIKIYGIP
jgi:hypothetical protein